MHLSPATDKQLIELMSWFSSQDELDIWSGTSINFPLSLDTLKSELKLMSLPSYCLLSEQAELLAFGQYYLRLGKCHLARLVVKPNLRGQGIVGHLITQLMHRGMTDLQTHACSLFVLEQNHSAIKSYQKFGFSFESYPEQLGLNNVMYMVQELPLYNQ